MGSKRLTDKQRKLIISDRVCGESIRAVAKKYGISATTVQRIVNADTAVAQKVTQKGLENTADTLAYMDQQHSTKKRILDKLLTAIETKADNVDMFTNIKDLATAYGILVDKELKVAEIKLSRPGGEDKVPDAMSQSLLELAGELDGD